MSITSTGDIHHPINIPGQTYVRVSYAPDRAPTILEPTLRKIYQTIMRDIYLRIIMEEPVTVDIDMEEPATVEIDIVESRILLEMVLVEKLNSGKEEGSWIILDSIVEELRSSGEAARIPL
jgi:hypothetical protein